MIVSKPLIARRFGLHAEHYDEVSPVQATMAAALMTKLPPGFVSHRILELGCGTGNLTAHLLRQFPEAAIIATDIAPAMLAAAARKQPANARICWQHADAETVSPQSPDLIIGSAVLQWLSNPTAVVRRLLPFLAPGGYAAFATFGPATFCELQRLLAEYGISHPLAQQPGPDCWRTALDGHFVDIQHDTVVTHASCAREFLRNISRSGAALPTAGLTFTQLRELLRRYDSQNAGDGIAVTWERIFVIIQRPGE